MGFSFQFNQSVVSRTADGSAPDHLGPANPTRVAAVPACNNSLLSIQTPLFSPAVTNSTISVPPIRDSDEEISVRRNTTFCLTLALTLSVSPFLEPPALSAESKTIWVAHRRVDCVAVVPQKCYLIKETQYEDWRFWYGEIEGFDFEEGYAYEIRVVERKIEDPPADAPAVFLELEEVILKVETFETPDPVTTPPAPPPSAPTVVEIEPVEPAPAPPEPVSEPVPVTPREEPAPPVADDAAPPPVTPPPVLPPTAPPAPTGEVFRGHLTIGAGVEARSFKLCGAEESIWVEDRTGTDLWGLYRRLASYLNRPVYMEVTGDMKEAPAGGFGAHFPRQILIRTVRNASVESAGCFAKPARYAFRATGNEPFWNVEISRSGLAFSELGLEERILFPYSPPTFFAEQIIYRGQVRGQKTRTLVVRLEEKPCQDSMADATFSHTATVEIDDRTLDGCARVGDEEP